MGIGSNGLPCQLGCHPKLYLLYMTMQGALPMLKGIVLASLTLFAAAPSAAMARASLEQDSTPNNQAYLLAQLSYEGYLTCQNTRGSCEVELNNKKAEIKQLCYQIWTNNWPESREYSPEVIRLYRGWCNKARSDIEFAEREFPPLSDYMSRYRNFDPTIESASAVQLALRNSSVFLSRCSAGAAQRASGAVELWGTRKYGDWVVPSLERLIPSRASQVISACDKKSWVRSLVAKGAPALAADWNAERISLDNRFCQEPSAASQWTRAKLEIDQSLVEKLNGFLSSGKFLQELSIPSSIISPTELALGIKQGASKLQACQAVVQSGSEIVSNLEARAEEERQRQEALALEKKRQLEAARAAAERRAAAARAAAEESAAAARAAAERQAAAARAAAEAKRRQQKERATMTNSVF